MKLYYGLVWQNSNNLSSFSSLILFIIQSLQNWAQCPSLATVVDLGFSIRVQSRSWMVHIIASGTHVSPLHDLTVKYSPGFMTRMWDHRTRQEYVDFSYFASALRTASKAPLRPVTAILAPNIVEKCSFIVAIWLILCVLFCG